MANLSPKIAIIILNINSLNIPIKRETLAEWIKKKTICFLQETHLKQNEINRLKAKGQNKIC